MLKINVIIIIGNKLKGSAQPMINKLGTNIRNEIKILLRITLIFKFVIDSIKPMTTHIEKADKFAFHAKFCIIIGITSMIPAIMPNKIPVFIFCRVDIFYKPPFGY